MSIDWLTVVAQIANFLLLVWLLKKFLYRPILNGIEARENEITRRMKAAEQARISAEQAEQHYEKLKAECVLEHETLLAQTEAATEQQREELLAKTRKQQIAEQQEWQRYLEREKQAFFQRLEQAGASSLFAMAEKVIRDLADEPLENAIARQLTKQLESQLPQLLESTAGQRKGEIISRIALNETTCQQLTQQLQAQIPGLELVFRQDDAQSPGVSLHVGGVQVCWTLASYLDEFGSLLADHRQQLAV